MDGLWVPSDAIHHFHLVYCGGRLSGMMKWCGGNVARWLCIIKVNWCKNFEFVVYSVWTEGWITEQYSFICFASMVFCIS